ncbi:MAG: hypothetical protein R3C39_11845 [Dehalococcoidia bacterium]
MDLGIGIDLGQRTDTVIFITIALVAVLVLVLSFVVGEVIDLASDVDVDGADGHLNVQTIAAFLAGFGSVGWLLSGYFDVPSLVAAAGGILGGLPMAALVAAMTRFFMKQEVSSNFALADLIGAQVRVTLAIPAAGVGRIQFERAGGTHSAAARSGSHQAIGAGELVTVQSVVAGECIVAAVEDVS